MTSDLDGNYEVDWIADAKFKLGFAMDEVLLYAFGGVSYLQTTAGLSTSEYDYGMGGFNYGIGADWAVSEQFTIGAEVLGRTVIDPYGGSDDNGDDVSHWQGMLRAAFHFGG